MGKETDNLIALANAGVDHAARPRDGHAAHHRRAHVHGAAVHGARRPRRRRASASPAARSASSPTPPTARRRSSRSRATGSARRWPTGKVCVVAGFQGVSHRAGDHHPRPGRLRHHRRRRWRPRFERRRLRDLHRRHRRVHADPRIVPQARKLPASASTRCSRWPAPAVEVLALRSVEFARNHGVPLHVRSSFTWEPGTWVTKRGAERMEDPIISGVVTRRERGQGHGRRRARPPGHLGRALRAARRGRTSTST